MPTARRAGHGIVLLVGDLPYYGPLGFGQLPAYAIILPAPVDPDRVLVAGLSPARVDGSRAGAASGWADPFPPHFAGRERQRVFLKMFSGLRGTR